MRGRGWLLLSLALVAGPSWAGDAWVGHYRIRDAQGERDLVLVRDETRVEYRVAGQPPRIWRQTRDGVALLELYPAARHVVAYAPGDLRASNLQPDWARLSGLVDPSVRAGLAVSGKATAFAQPLVRYRGTNQQGRPVALDWLSDAGLPARYCIGERCDSDQDEGVLQLRELKRMPAQAGFSSLEGLLEIDHADLGDMEKDPFAQGLSHAEFPGHE